MMPVSLDVATCRAVAAGNDKQLSIVQALRADLQRKQDRIEELESLIGLRPDMPNDLPLSQPQRDILGMLMRAPGVVTAERMITAHYGALPLCDRPRSRSTIVRVHICRLRKFLGQHQIEIDTDRSGAGVGYGMRSAMKARTRDLIARMQAERGS